MHLCLNLDGNRSNIIEEAHSTTKRQYCQLCGGYGHNCLTCKQYNGEGSDYQDEENMTAFDDNNIDDLA